MDMKYMFLQLFAAQGAGEVTNTLTNGYVNSYTGDSEATNALEGELKTFFDTELLENARVDMIYAQFAKKQPLPANHGNEVEWRKFNTFARAEKLQEGVIPTGQKMGMTVQKAKIEQYGTYVTISDTLDLRSYDPIVMVATEEMGASAAETQEVLIRDALLSNKSVLFCDNLDADGNYKNTPTANTAMGASDATGWALLTPDMVAKAATILKKNKAPTIGGKYVAVVHPSVAYDLRKSKEWIEAHKYAATGEIFNGEIGELHGVRFIENTFAPVLKGEVDEDLTDTNEVKVDYTNADGGVTYATYFFGRDAFAIIDPAGGALQMIAHDKAQIGGPLNQFSTVGYKFETNGATVLYPERLLRVMSTSSYSADDEAN